MVSRVEWGLSWALRAAVVAVVVLTLLLLITTWPANSAIDRESDLDHPKPVPQAEAGAGVVCTTAGRAPTLQLNLHEFMINSAVLRINPAICLSTEFLSTLRANEPGHPKVAFVGSDNMAHIRRAYRGVVVTVSVLWGIRNSQAYVQRIPLGALQPDVFQSTAALPAMQMPIWGSAAGYPLDKYETTGDVDITFSDGVVGGGKGRTSDFTGPPQVEGEPNLGTFTMVQGGLPGFGNTAIIISRSRETKEFVGLLLAVVAALVLALALYTTRRRTTAEKGPDILVGAAAILVALLPVRLVLVPGDVPGVTVVDLVLGLLIAVLAALGVWSIPIPNRKVRRSAEP